jgi:hypothetical protein
MLTILADQDPIIVTNGKTKLRCAKGVTPAAVRKATGKASNIDDARERLAAANLLDHRARRRKPSPMVESVFFRVSPNTLDRIDQAAKTAGVDRSDWVRRVVEAALPPS